MMPEQNHQINSVKFHLQSSDRRGMQDLQFRYQQAWQKRMIPQLQILFDELTDENELLQIDKLEIDLGALKSEISDEELTELLMRELKLLISDANHGVSRNTVVQQISMTNVGLRQLIQFLEKGYWPTAKAPDNLSSLMTDLLEKEQSLVLDSIRKAYGKSGKEIMLRLIHQFSFELLSVIVLAYNTAEQRIAPSYVKRVLKNLAKDNRETQAKVWTMLLPCWLENKESLVAERLQTIRHFEKALSMEFNFSKAILKLDREFFQKDDKVELLELHRIKNEEEALEGIPGYNMGVLLLHPFLQSYFSESQLLDKSGQFKDVQSAERAMGLLHFLATGESEAPESMLSFQKAFCGLPQQHPVPAQFEITTAERSEAEKMMNAAIQYWDALGDVSSAGLSEGFFQRPGAINIQGEALNVIIKKETMDILLDRLPWNISMIKMPWLKKIINVTWN